MRLTAKAARRTLDIAANEETEKYKERLLLVLLMPALHQLFRLLFLGLEVHTRTYSGFSCDVIHLLIFQIVISTEHFAPPPSFSGHNGPLRSSVIASWLWQPKIEMIFLLRFSKQVAVEGQNIVVLHDFHLFFLWDFFRAQRYVTLPSDAHWLEWSRRVPESTGRASGLRERKLYMHDKVSVTLRCTDASVGLRFPS